MANRAGKIDGLRLTAYIIMVAGILLFVLTPLFIKYLNFDTDVLGILVVILGFVFLILSQVIRVVVNKARRRKSA